MNQSEWCPQSDFQLAICYLVSTSCVLKNGNNCGTSVHLINFTVCNRSLVAVLVRHWADTTQSSSTVFELVIQHRERVSQYVKLAILHSQLSTRCSAARQRYFGVATLGTFLKMLHLTTSATSSLLLKISAFTIVYNVFFTLA